MSPLHIVTWLSQTSFSNWLRYSPYPYSLLIMIHVITLAVFGGVVVLGNLRVLGFAMRSTPVAEVLDQFRVWKRVGFGILLVTGILLTLSDPMEYYTNSMYWVSMVVLLLGGINAWIFHHGAERTIADWDDTLAVPPAARTWAICSLALWISLVGIGRAIAFF